MKDSISINVGVGSKRLEVAILSSFFFRQVVGDMLIFSQLNEVVISKLQGSVRYSR